jgi:hypothetical protein
MRRHLVFCCLAALAWSAVIAAQTMPPHTALIIGTWKQDMQKSTYSPGSPPPPGFGAVRQYAAGEDGSVVSVTFNLNAQGMPSLGAIAAANYDGRDYAQHTVATLATSLGAHTGPQIARTISYTPIDQYSIAIVAKQNGRVVSKSVRTVSRDGKTMTEEMDYTDDGGRHVHNLLVFDKQ